MKLSSGLEPINLSEYAAKLTVQIVGTKNIVGNAAVDSVHTVYIDQRQNALNSY